MPTSSVEKSKSEKSEIDTSQPKILKMVVSAKGGTGKSILTFLLAEKYSNALVLDMDSETPTTSSHLAYRKPKFVSFKNESATIDRGYFMDLLEQISKASNQLIIADLGAAESGQFPEFLIDNDSETLQGNLLNSNITLELHCVVAGGDMFITTASYLNTLAEAAKGLIPIKVMVNGYFEMHRLQKEQLDIVVKKYDLELHHFNISRDKNNQTQNNIKSVIQAGQGVAGAGVFYKSYFNNAINKLTV